MRVSYPGDPKGYSLWLSANDTYRWAHRAGNSWPCSTLSGKRIALSVDSNGINYLTVNGKEGVDVDENELTAIVADHLPKELRHLWPTWEF
jgi:hypothetical protein